MNDLPPDRASHLASRLRDAALLAGLAVVYFIAGKLGLELAYVHASATAVWPPTGIALAAFLLLGRRFWPAIFAGAFLVNLTTEGTVLTSLGIAAGNTLEGIAGSWLIDRFAHGRLAFQRPRDIFRFAALAGVVSTALSASIGVTSLWLGGFAPAADFGAIWGTWWLGDVGGALVVAPLLILWAVQPSLPRWSRGRVLEAALLLVSLVLVGLVAFADVIPRARVDPLSLLAIPVLAWAAFRFNPRETATATSLLFSIAVWGCLRGAGPFASPNEALVLLQAFMGVTGVTTLIVSASVAERRRAEEALSRIAAIVESSEDAIVGKTLDGVITSWNGGAERLYGYAADEVIGRHISILAPPDRQDEMPRILEKIRRGESVAPFETVRVCRGGRRVTISLTVSPIRDSGLDVLGASAIARDITERRQAEQRLATQFAVTRVLAEPVPLREAAPRLLRAVCEGLEFETGELWLEEAGPRCEARWPSESERSIPAGVPDSVVNVGIRAGNRLAGNLSFYRRDAVRPAPALLDLMTDLGVRVGQFLERERVMENLKRLQKAVETIQLGVTITDTSGRILYTNPAEAGMHGYDPEELIGKHVSVFIPAGWKPAASHPSGIQSWRRETVNVRRDGTVFPVQLLSDAVLSEEGRPVAVVTCAEEITERKLAEEALRSSEERYRLLFERNLAGVYRATLDGRLMECNDAFARILGYSSREEILGCSSWDLFFTREERAAAVAQLRQKGTLTNVELRMRRRDGSPAWVLENETMLHAGGEDLVEATLIDITDRKEFEQRIEFDAYHDALTGLANRAFMKERLKTLVADACTFGRGLAVLFLDIDRFKSINDSLGHTAGDQLLQVVASRLRECVRENDLVARVGGDEFVLLLPHVRREGAARIARSILMRTRKPLRLDGRELAVTASIGIALHPEDGADAATLLRNADGAMYRVKDSGRNASQFWTRM